MLPTISPKFDQFISPARKKPQLWRLVLGVLLVGAIYFGTVMGIFALATLALDRSEIGLFRSTGTFGGTPVQMAVLLSTFLGLSLGTFVAAGLLHRRNPLSLFGPNLRAVMRNFVLVFVLFAAVMAVFLAMFTRFEPPVANLPFDVWLKWLPASLVLLFIQISAEELFFRGYLQQQLAARFASRWIWWVLPSAVFGLLHFEPSVMGSNAWLVVIGAGMVGLIAADLTARTGNLGAALGLHFANNLFAILFMSVDGTLNGLSLYVTPYAATDHEVLRPLLIIDISISVIGYFVYLQIMRRKGL